MTIPAPFATRVKATAACDRAEAQPAPRQGPVRYADPAAWLVLDTITELLRVVSWEPPAEAAERHGVGVIGISDRATAYTLARVARDAAAGTVSPLRFAAASPGTLIGLSCSHFGFTGPSLLLTMPVSAGRPVAAAIAAHWLGGTTPSAHVVIVATHNRDSAHVHHAECTWLEASASTRWESHP
jgi:hypothetical protein